MIFANEEFKIITKKWLYENFNVASNTIYSILKGVSYKDYKLDYEKLTQDQKNQLVSLLRNQQKQTP